MNGMNGPTVKYKMKFGKNQAKAEKPTANCSPAPSRAARMLALAYLVERLIECGLIKDYAEAARGIGISRARVSQLVKFLNLSVKNQEAILLGKLEVSERQLRGALCEVEWEQQVVERDDRIL